MASQIYDLVRSGGLVGVTDVKQRVFAGRLGHDHGRARHVPRERKNGRRREVVSLGEREVEAGLGFRV